MDPQHTRRQAIATGGVMLLGATSGCIHPMIDDLFAELQDDETADGQEPAPQDPGPQDDEHGDDGQHPPEQTVNDTVPDPVEDTPITPPDDPEPPAVEPDSLARYVSQTYGYSILHPESWKSDESDPATVFFYPESEEGFQLVQTLSSEEPIELETYTEAYITASEETYEGYEVTNQRSVTLPGGQTGRILDSTDQSEGIPWRDKVLLLTLDTTIYVNHIAMHADAYTDEFDRIANQICESLTIPPAT